jgi:menaquinone-9 beta-reductase
MITADVAVIGAGVAGCAAALRAQQLGLRVVLFEKSTGRRTKFCGEFVSGETRAVLDALGALDVVEASAPQPVRRMSLNSPGGRRFEMPLQTEGFGLSRRNLDGALLDAAARQGVATLRGCAAESIEGGPREEFTIRSSTAVRARAAIGAWGKRSPLDRRLQRPFLAKPARYVGVKLHYGGAEIQDEVSLYSFPGGHCGFVNVEGGLATLAMLARAETLRKCGGKPKLLLEFAVRSNGSLARRLERARPVEGSLMAIAQVPLTAKEPTAGGIFLAGDSAGLTAPFLGLGMLAALCSGVAAADGAAAALAGEGMADAALRNYARWWRRRFGLTQRWSFLASRLLSSSHGAEAAVACLRAAPAVGRLLYAVSRSFTNATVPNAARNPVMP